MLVSGRKENFTQWFLAPKDTKPPTRAPKYVLQSAQRYHKHFVLFLYYSFRSKLALKSRKAFQSMEALEVDFFNPADDILDPFSALHAKEAALVAQDPTKVSRAALWLNIRQVFSLPRRMGSTDQVLDELITTLATSNF